MLLLLKYPHLYQHYLVQYAPICYWMQPSVLAPMDSVELALSRITLKGNYIIDDTLLMSYINICHNVRGLKEPTCPICNITPSTTAKPSGKAPLLTRAPDSDDESIDHDSAMDSKSDTKEMAQSIDNRKNSSERSTYYIRSIHLDSIVNIITAASHVIQQVIF